jgi:hypothetical protein
MITKPYPFQWHRAVPDPDLMPGAVLYLINLRENLPVRFPIKLCLFRRTLRAVSEIPGWIDGPWMHPPWKRFRGSAPGDDIIYAVQFTGNGIDCVKVVCSVLMEHFLLFCFIMGRKPVLCHFKMEWREKGRYQAAVVTEKLVTGTAVTYIPTPDVVTAQNAVERFPWIWIREKKEPSGRLSVCIVLITFHRSDPPPLRIHNCTARREG